MSACTCVNSNHRGPPAPACKPYFYHSLDAHLSTEAYLVGLRHVECSMDGHVHGLMMTWAMVQHSQNAAHPREHPSAQGSDPICRAQHERKMQGALYKSHWEFQDGNHRTLHQASGSSKQGTQSSCTDGMLVKPALPRAALGWRGPGPENKPLSASFFCVLFP